MITPEIITRDESRGLTFFIAELQTDKTYAVFSIFDIEASENKAATLEFIGGSVNEALEAMKIALRPQKKSKDTSATEDEEEQNAPSKRKRISVP
ncbi:hypothetical protein UFOVP1246_17 [uncultured Caudovirales phage]|jgi:hypothetical protein|uniref:Uncharacterized protein n=1 Tax=uncultured Caudovirales phage TaxID=2100421 RepID=A0A6J5RL49_9CAUD|nr:hypothetical protein UFOVP1246_17 [uncultured Caudovirales phage]